jgi:hypothetical protein
MKGITTLKTNYLNLSWSTSKGRGTYGYNIARLDDRATGQRFKCMGGGYDITGTVVGEWLATTYQPRLRAAGAAVTDLYGSRVKEGGEVSLYGACGLECMIKVAAAIGISLSRTSNKRGHTSGFMVTDYGSADLFKRCGGQL